MKKYSTSMDPQSRAPSKVKAAELCALPLTGGPGQDARGGKGQREKWAGMARWHNFVIGGCDTEGNDATNDVTYLTAGSCKGTKTPHNTLTIRVSKNTPKELLIKGLELVRTGIGMPAFISEDSYIKLCGKRRHRHS